MKKKTAKDTPPYRGDAPKAPSTKWAGSVFGVQIYSDASLDVGQWRPEDPHVIQLVNALQAFATTLAEHNIKLEAISIRKHS